LASGGGSRVELEPCLRQAVVVVGGECRGRCRRRE
jgi:hypothetical protein